MTADSKADDGAWRAAVAAELKDAAFEKTLCTQTSAGITLQPLYTAQDAPAVPPLARSGSPWVCVPVPVEGAWQQVVKQHAADGVHGVWLGGMPAQGLRDVADGLRLVRVDGPQTAALLADVPADAQVWALTDPVASVLAGQPRPAWSREWFERTPATWRLAGVDTRRVHLAGGHEVHEIGVALASVVAALRELEALGLTAAQVHQRFAVTMPIGRNVFAQMAKLRALKLCMGRVWEVCGVEDAETVVHAVSSTRSLSVLDPEVNALRVTCQMFSALCGGAQVLTAAPYDALEPAADAVGDRLAVNTLWVLLEEAHLGEVTDVARGSYFMDSLAQQMAQQAWSFFQNIERCGGIHGVLADGWLRTQVDEAAAANAQRVATRVAAITGVSEYARADEEPRGVLGGQPPGWPVARDAEPYEVLRTRSVAHSAQVHVVRLGSSAEAGPRIGFSVNLFAAGGFKVVQQPDAPHWQDSDLDAAVAAAAGANVVCVCASDARLAALGAQAVSALKKAGAKRVYVAGRHPELTASGADGFVFAGMDAVAFLGEVIDAH